MTLTSYSVTVGTKEDSPFNVLPNTPIEIRLRSNNTLATIFSDEAGLSPIAQTGATTDSNGTFFFFAEPELYNAISNNITIPLSSSRVKASDTDTNSGNNAQIELDALTAGQIGGLIVRTTKALLDAFTPSGSSEEESSYKVTDDPTSSNNGFYHWNGAIFVKDADLVQNVIDPDNTSEGVSGFAVDTAINVKANLETGKNLLDPNRVLDGFFLSDDGTFTASPSNQVFDFVPVTAGLTYSPSKTFRFSTYYDAVYNVVAGGANSNFSTPFVIPGGVAFVRLTGTNTAGNEPETYQLEENLTETVFELFTHTVPLDEMSDAFIAKRAEQLDSPLTFESIGLFNTLRANEPVKWDIDLDGDGALITVLESTTFGLMDIIEGIPAGDDYEVTVYYELEQLNCDNVDIKIQTYFSNGTVATFSTLTDNEVGVASSFTVNVTNNNNATTNLQVTPVCIGPETVALGFFAKFRIRNVTVVKRDAALQFVPRINVEFGQPKEGTNYLTVDQQALYAELSTTDHLDGRNLVNLVGPEKFILQKGVTKIADDANPLKNFTMSTSLDSYMAGRTGFVYYKWKFVINSFNGDSWNIVIRGADGDSEVKFYQKDVGVVQTITAVRGEDGGLDGSHFLLCDQNEIFTNGVSGASNDGNETIGSITLVDAFGYYSEEYIPVYNHTELFELDSDSYSVDTFANQQIQELKMNTYGDSITEHNYPQFLGIDGYNFLITRYGLRANVSDKAGPGTGAANFANFNVMDDDADIVMIMFGTHDMGNDVPIGSIGTLDIDTYIGAMEILIQGLIVKYPSRLILVSTPPQRAIGSTANEWFLQQTVTGVPYRDYIDALILLCNQYGMQYFDMWAGAGISPFNMSGTPNLYISANATDDTLLDATGTPTVDVDWFTSEFIAVEVLKNYLSSVACYFVEYGAANAFIRRSPASSTFLSLHPDTLTVRVSVEKTEVIIEGTPVGVSIDRYSFADAEQATMPDRIHPNAKSQRLMCATIEQKLKPILDSPRLLADLRGNLFVDGD